MVVPKESQAKRRIKREETVLGIPFRGWVIPGLSVTYRCSTGSW